MADRDRPPQLPHPSLSTDSQFTLFSAFPTEFPMLGTPHLTPSHHSSGSIVSSSGLVLPTQAQLNSLPPTLHPPSELAPASQAMFTHEHYHRLFLSLLHSSTTTGHNPASGVTHISLGGSMATTSGGAQALGFPAQSTCLGPLRASSIAEPEGSEKFPPAGDLPPASPLPRLSQASSSSLAASNSASVQASPVSTSPSPRTDGGDTGRVASLRSSHVSSERSPHAVSLGVDTVLGNRAEEMTRKLLGSLGHLQIAERTLSSMQEGGSGGAESRWQRDSSALHENLSLSRQRLVAAQREMIQVLRLVVEAECPQSSGAQGVGEGRELVQKQDSSSLKRVMPTTMNKTQPPQSSTEPSQEPRMAAHPDTVMLEEAQERPSECKQMVQSVVSRGRQESVLTGGTQESSVIKAGSTVLPNEGAAGVIVSRQVLEVVTQGTILDPSHDGFIWKKYGKKLIKDSRHPRAYYRCAEETCFAKKSMQLLREVPQNGSEAPQELAWVAGVAYENQHNHPKPGAQSSPKHERAGCPALPTSPQKESSLSGLSHLALPFLRVVPRSKWAKEMTTEMMSSSGLNRVGSVSSGLRHVRERAGGILGEGTQKPASLQERAEALKTRSLPAKWSPEGTSALTVGLGSSPPANPKRSWSAHLDETSERSVKRRCLADELRALMQHQAQEGPSAQRGAGEHLSHLQRMLDSALPQGTPLDPRTGRIGCDIARHVTQLLGPLPSPPQLTSVERQDTTGDSPQSLEGKVMLFGKPIG